jgi:hypothetical protein
MITSVIHAADPAAALTFVPNTPSGGRNRNRQRWTAVTFVATVAVLVCATSAANAQCNPTWMLRSTTGPQAREGAMMAFDSVRQRVVMFGGGNAATGSRLNDTWEWDGSSWTQRFPSGVLPAPRFVGTVAFDKSRGRLVLFGGNAVNGTVNYGDSWEWDGQAWAQVLVPGPAVRATAGMAFDQARNVVVLVGGQTGNQQPYRETWHWNGGAWSLASSLGPSGRYGPGLAYDSGREVCVLFGGTSFWGNSQVFNETWEWHGTTWSQRATTLSPPGRRFQAFAFDKARGATVMFGGDQTNSAFLADTWLWSGNEWTNLPITGPSARKAPAMAYDEARGELVLFGGSDTTVRADTWVLPSPLGVIQSPQSVQTCVSSNVTYTVHAVGPGSLSFAWRKDTIAIDTLANPSAATATLTLNNVQSADAGSYDCIVTNSCGSVTSNAATLTVCAGDINCDESVNFGDFLAFFNCYDTETPCADIDGNPGVDFGDFLAFFNAYDAGC